MSTPADIDFRTLVSEIVDLDHRKGTRRPSSSRDTRSEQPRYASLDTANTAARPSDYVDDQPDTLHSRKVPSGYRTAGRGTNTGQTGPCTDDAETGEA
ncbi:hypothetical protein [Streptomyces sp. NBC_01589]|uniref:hypothetical protein n=1 Tax=unclassified Streptomyces TaxID=2593676 RepID=UPI0038650ED2